MNRSTFRILLAAVLAFSLVGCRTGVGPREDATGANVERRISSDLRPFLESYFATWSSGDMKGYKSHFDDWATVTFIDKGKVVLAMPRDMFVDLQAQLKTTGTKVERMTSFTADEDDAAATVTAKWLLENGREKVTGVDRFTLIRSSDGSWKIISLLFYNDP